VLTGRDLIVLADLGRLLEERFGCPQDVEWAIAGGELYVLQSRPVTTL
jgi:pyruvate,water dikinase